MKSWQKNIDKYQALNNELENTIAKINVLASSKQVYDVVYDMGGTERDFMGIQQQRIKQHIIVIIIEFN